MSKRKAPEGKKGLDEWMGTYGDMVTLLLCFFVLLFSMSSVDAAKFEQIAASFSDSPNILKSTSPGILNAMGNGIMQQPMKNKSKASGTNKGDKSGEEVKTMAGDFRTYFAKNGLSDKIQIDDSNEQYLTISFAEGILFDSGKSDLKPEALDVLDLVANEMLKYPENDIKIEGHTDNRPINTAKYPNNWYLSAARAISVAMFFTDNKGFAPTRISTEGFGEFRPVKSNDTPENRAANRRVEIKILSKYYSNEGFTKKGEGM